MVDFYTTTGTPGSHATGSSSAIRAEFTAIETAMAKLAGYTGNGSKFLRVNAAGTAYEALTVADALAALAPNSAALATALADTTGTGVFVRTQAPTLTSASLVTPALGTPASGVLTNCTGTAAGLTAGNVTTNANLTGHITSTGNATVLGTAAFTSANLAAALTDETGSGAAVFATSPTLVTPALGTPSALVGTNITGTAAGLSIGGNAATATNVGIADDNTTNAVMYPTWVTAAGGNIPPKVTSTKLSFNPNTGELRSTSFNAAGAISSSSPTAGIGYATGAGNSATVSGGPTSFNVTVNGRCGKISIPSQAWTAGATATILVTNNNSNVLNVISVSPSYAGPSVLVSASYYDATRFIILIYPTFSSTAALDFYFSINPIVIN